MSTGASESAIAKRRRLNDCTSTRASDSVLPATTKVVKKTKAKQQVRDVHVSANNVLAIDASNRISSGEVLERSSDNSFEPLVGANVVKFSGLREIEVIDQAAIKVQLSRFQKCYVYGIAKLWVRNGSVSAYGATLAESIQAYLLFASTSDAPVTIKAESDTAEFQLESISHSDTAAVSPLNVPGRIRRTAKDDAMSFRVLGQGEEPAYPEIPSIQYPDSRYTDPTSHERVATIDFPTFPAPHILICGKRSNSTSLSSIALMNRIISDATASTTGKGRRGIAFLDLDFSSPAFGCPGTLSVAHMQSCVLGPSYTHPLAVDGASSNRLIASIFVGSDEYSKLKVPGKAMIEYLTKVDKSLQDLPWVIRTGTWLATASPRDLLQLHKATAPDLVLYIDESKNSAYYDAAVTLAQRESTKLAHVPCHRSGTESYLAEHRNTLQSHFRFYGYVDDVPLWHAVSMLANETRRLVLSINDRERGLSFVSVRGGVLRREDILEALQGALVTLVGGYSGTKSSLRTAWIGLPKDDGLANLCHLGLAYVEQVDEVSGMIRLNTRVTTSRIQQCFGNGLEVGLVLEKPGPHGWGGRQLLFE